MMSTIESFFNSAVAWAEGHTLFIAFVVYILLNVAKRLPPPKQPVLLWFWNFTERLMFLTWDKWGGKLKPLFTIVPEPPTNSEPPKHDPPSGAAKGGTILTGILVLSLAMMPIGCIPPAKVAPVIRILDDVTLATEMLDSAWHAYCVFDKSTCEKISPTYEYYRGVMLQSLRIAKATAEASSSEASVTEVRAAYGELEKLLLELGVVRVPDKTGISVPGFTPRVVPSPFPEQQ